MDDWTPHGSAEAGPPPARVPLWRRLPIGLLVLGVLVVGGGVSSWFLGADRGDTGEIAKPGDLTAVDLRVGDCFDFKDPEAEVFEEVTARPCAQEHEFELFFTGPMPQGAYPDDAAFDAFVLANCDPAFETYVGTGFQESALDVTWISPNEDAWGQGDRSIQCAVSDPSAPRRTGSLKASNR